MDQEKLDTPINIETQDQILLAALRLFTQKGYFNTSLIDIKQAAGIPSLSVLYQNFPTKQAIAAALHASIVDNLNVSIDDIRRRHQKSPEQLRAIVDLLFKLTDDAPDVVRFLFLLNWQEFLPDEKPLMALPAFDKVTKIIQAGIKAGEIRNIDTVLVYAHFFGVIHSTLFSVLSGGLDKKAETYSSQTWLSAWNVIANKR